MASDTHRVCRILPLFVALLMLSVVTVSSEGQIVSGTQARHKSPAPPPAPTPPPNPTPTPTPGAGLHMLDPSYYSPGSSAWNSAAAAGSAVSFIVANPDSGPGSSASTS